MKSNPESVVGTFISSFVTDLLAGDVDSAIKPFSLEAHCSTLTHVAHDGHAIFAHTGAHILPTLHQLSEHFAGSTGAEVTQLSAVELPYGVQGTVLLNIATSHAVHVVQLVVLLEQFVEESFFARAVTFTILHVQAVEPVAVPVEEPVEVAVPAPAPVEEVAAPVIVEELVAKPAKGKGKKGKKVEETAAPVVEETPAPAPVEEVVAAPVEEVAAPAPVEEVPAPVAAAPARPESPAPTGTKSWATLAAVKPVAGAVAPKAAPVRVAPPTKEEAPAAPVEAAPEKKSKATARSPVPRHEGAGDKLVFTVASAVTDEQVHAALGQWSKSVASLRNVSANHQRVFVDFTVEGVLEEITKAKITIGGQKAPVYRQKPKE